MEKNKEYEGVERGSSAGLDEEFTLGLSEEPAGGRRGSLLQVPGGSTFQAEKTAGAKVLKLK